MMRKIIVSGCASCPYFTAWNNGEGNGVDSIVAGSCSHPQFNRELLKPQFGSTVFFKYEVENTQGERVNFSNVHAVKPNATPAWCPLPEL